jgi:hypothetical protein
VLAFLICRRAGFMPEAAVMEGAEEEYFSILEGISMAKW